MRSCTECGLPRKFSRTFDWRSDGTIVGRNLKVESRIIFLESSELQGLFDDLSAILGVPIDPILIEAEKNIGNAIYWNTPLRLLRFVPYWNWMRPAWLAKTSVRLMRGDVAGLGGGAISADAYKAGDSMVLRYANPCFVPRTVGTSLGIYESIEGIRGADYQYAYEGGDLVITMSHPRRTSEPLAETRLRLDPVCFGEGPLLYERCGRCGAPLEVCRAMEYDLEGGMITNRLTGKRELVGGVQSIAACIRELEVELGEDVLNLLFACQKEITRWQLERDYGPPGEGFRDRCLLEFALRGLGYPTTLEQDGDSVTIEIFNAYDQTLYAARLAAVVECETGGVADVEWSARHKQRAAYTITAS
ncbi:MAG: hypothetical protein KKF41_14465 [Actinobacteria bacterium]|nr:hypothetical protein [Actinomycetota bacterium]MBU1943754.1 hypothetical protein [Actinomycetota bacterium]MBU2688778.1 hypothetical protein [Actinomycetota bacterium]